MNLLQIASYPSFKQMPGYICAALMIVILINACTPTNIKEQAFNHQSTTVQQCRKLIAITDDIISDAGVKDVQHVRISQYPYLRINRFLSSFRSEVKQQTFEHWVDNLQTLALQDWKIEINNLPSQFNQRLAQLSSELLPAIRPLQHKLEHCSKTLKQFELSQAFHRKQLKNNAVVPTEYNNWQQILGFYPLTAIPFRYGIYRWHQQALETFNKLPRELPVTGKLLLYIPEINSPKLSQKQIAKILKASSTNPLQIPIPTTSEQQQLFANFAPHFEIDTLSENDTIGNPEWDNSGNIQINTSKPVVFQHISHTRIQAKPLLQLNYSIWFPSRPKTSIFDLLGGHLDGIIWRVTLDMEGKPLIFDSIHACGCYHFFFPSQYSRIIKTTSLFQEPLFAPQKPFEFNPALPVIIRIGSSKHYIQKIYSPPVISSVTRNYRFDQADHLRAIPFQNEGKRSLYNEDGIINGSERGERFLFWPMGVPNPGAMRQWGHHATAFVGRRHFDDADIFERTLKLINPADY